MADQRILYSESMVGAGHPTLSDTLNRLALVEHTNEGLHKIGVGGVGNAALAYVDAATVKVVHRDSGNDPSTDDPVMIMVGGEARMVTAALSVALPGGLDTGSEAAGTDYYVWATRDGLSTGFSLKISASKSSPTGLTTKLLLGGFHNDPASNILSNSVYSLARNERDKEGMVKVGPIWVDIYIASVWTTPTGGTQRGASGDDYGCGDHAGDCSGLYARSVYNVIPSRFMSWFQAQRFCMNNGKRLLTNAEWQGAALGTPDPGATPGANDCNTNSADPTGTGTRSNCRSWAGVYDAIGNVWEWAADWFAGTRGTAESPGSSVTWGPGQIDRVWNARGSAYNDGDTAAYKDGIPAAAIRGGYSADAAAAGVFALNLDYAPWFVGSAIGFRCAGQ
jgi:hypothetical protein